jgi:hypothetical protein
VLKNTVIPCAKTKEFVVFVQKAGQYSIDLSPFELNFDLNKSGQKFHHSLKQHHKISNIRCEML